MKTNINKALTLKKEETLSKIRDLGWEHSDYEDRTFFINGNKTVEIIGDYIAFTNDDGLTSTLHKREIKLFYRYADILEKEKNNA